MPPRASGLSDSPPAASVSSLASHETFAGTPGFPWLQTDACAGRYRNSELSRSIASDRESSAISLFRRPTRCLRWYRTSVGTQRSSLAGMPLRSGTMPRSAQSQNSCSVTASWSRRSAGGQCASAQGGSPIAAANPVQERRIGARPHRLHQGPVACVIGSVRQTRDPVVRVVGARGTGQLDPRLDDIRENRHPRRAVVRRALPDLQIRARRPAGVQGAAVASLTLLSTAGAGATEPSARHRRRRRGRGAFEDPRVTET